MKDELKSEFENNKAEVKQMVDDITTMIDEKYPGELAKATIAFYIVNKYHKEYLKQILDTEIPEEVRKMVDKEITGYFKQFSHGTDQERKQNRWVTISKLRYMVKIVEDKNSFFNNCEKEKKSVKEDEGITGIWTFYRQGKNTLLIIAPDTTVCENELKNRNILSSRIGENVKKFCQEYNIVVDWNTFKEINKPQIITNYQEKQTTVETTA